MKSPKTFTELLAADARYFQRNTLENERLRRRQDHDAVGAGFAYLLVEPVLTGEAMAYTPLTSAEAKIVRERGGRAIYHLSMQRKSNAWNRQVHIPLPVELHNDPMPRRFAFLRRVSEGR